MQVMESTYFGNRLSLFLSLSRTRLIDHADKRGLVRKTYRPLPDPTRIFPRYSDRYDRLTPCSKDQLMSHADAGRQLASPNSPRPPPPLRRAAADSRGVWSALEAPLLRRRPSLSRIPTTLSFNPTPTTCVGNDRTPFPTRMRRTTGGQANDSWPTEPQRTIRVDDSLPTKC